MQGTQPSGVGACNRCRTSDVSTPRAPSRTAAGSGGCRVRIWASTRGAVTSVFRRLGLTASSSTFFAAGVMRRRSLLIHVSDLRLLRDRAHRQWGSVGAGPQAEGAQGFMVERLEGLASFRQAHVQRDFDRGVLQQGEQEVIGTCSPVTSATSFLTGLQRDGPDVEHLWHEGFGVA